MKTLIKTFFLLISISTAFSFIQQDKNPPKALISFYEHIGNEWIYKIARPFKENLHKNYVADKDTVEVKIIEKTKDHIGNSSITWQLDVKQNNIIKIQEQEERGHEETRHNLLLDEYINQLYYCVNGRNPYGKVVDFGTVTVPAGVFNDVLVSISGFSLMGNYNRIDSIFFKDQIGIIKKTSWERSLSPQYNTEIWELVSYKL